MELNYHNNPLTLKKKRTNNTTLFKPKQTRKTDTSTTPPCTECGKKFYSWKALFGHMRCHPERNWRGINPPENLRPENLDDMTDEEHEVAAALLLLANGSPLNQVTECSSASFECSSCKKVFGSHQALGGHRASHKNVKGCFAINRNYEEWDEKNEELGEGHKCNICWRVFSSGQALGGHMRCHWDPVRVCGNVASTTGFDLNWPIHNDDDEELVLDLRLGL